MTVTGELCPFVRVRPAWFPTCLIKERKEGSYRLPFRSRAALEGKGFHVHCLNTEALTLPAFSVSLVTHSGGPGTPGE